jgi:hypothetical protein
MYTFKKVSQSQIPWKTIEGALDSTCFHSEKWNNYLKKIGIKPYVIEILQDDIIIGYFIGEKLGLGIYIITAPIEGIGTYTQGLCMLDVISEEERVNIYQDLAKWLFENKEALLLQVDDWQLRRTSETLIPYEEFRQETLDEMNIPYSVRPTLCVPVNTSIEEMWGNLHYKSCKYSINKAKKLGLQVKEITNYDDIEEFTKIHYAQLKEVCAKQGMRPKPSQQQKRMKALCESLYPDRLIMLEVIGKDDNGVEQVMSTGIYGLDKGQCIYWTGARYQRYQKYCPNELMVWEAMRLAHQRGGGILNFGGMATYKLKFGTVYEYVPRIAFAKYPWMLSILPWLKKQYHNTKRLIAKVVGKKSFK